MSTYKQFLSSDIIISPFEVNKSFHFTGSGQLTGSNVEIDRLLGEKTNETHFTPEGWVTTGDVKSEYRFLVYNSIKELYYSNYISTSSLSGDQNAASGSYFNYLQSDLYFKKYFPTESGAYVGVFTIPSKLYGNRIQPKSFRLTSGSNITITDDGEGNLIYNSNICGNIFYNHGMAVITSNGQPGNDGGALYGEAVFGTDIYGATLDTQFVENFITTEHITCSFSSSFNIFETQYKCTLRANEFNYSLNPSLLNPNLRGQNNILNSGSNVYNDFVTSSDFSPFVTTVGLYNNEQELIAVGKLAQPLLTSQTTDTTILINIDR